MAIVAGMLFIAGAPFRVFLALGAPALAVILFMTFQRSARLSRIQSFMDPFADYEGAGWQAAHSLFALASGGWWGLGLGASREKWGSLPEAHTDFIFAIIGEELGLVGTLTVLLLFGALILGALRISLATDDLFVRFAAGGIVVWIGAQMVINIGGVLSVLPITGVPLPLVSYGGSALLATMFALGMLLAFARDLPGAREALRDRRSHRWRPTAARSTGSVNTDAPRAASSHVHCGSCWQAVVRPDTSSRPWRWPTRSSDATPMRWSRRSAPSRGWRPRWSRPAGSPSGSSRRSRCLGRSRGDG